MSKAGIQTIYTIWLYFLKMGFRFSSFEEDPGIYFFFFFKEAFSPSHRLSPCLCYFFIFFIIYLFIWLCWVFVSVARAFSSCGKREPLFIAVRGPLTIAASPVAEHRLQTRRLSNCGSRAQLLRGMWDPPRPGLEPMSPALAGRFSTTAPPGKPLESTFKKFLISHLGTNAGINHPACCSQTNLLSSSSLLPLPMFRNVVAASLLPSQICFAGVLTLKRIQFYSRE